MATDYDAYILATSQSFDRTLFQQMPWATALHRETTAQIMDVDRILKDIEKSSNLRTMWEKYRRQFSYAADTFFETILDVLNQLCE